MDSIDKIFYINLDKRHDRRQEIEYELVNNFKYTRAERFSAIEYNPGCYGCSMSHISLFRKMIEQGWETIMVFEDDAQLLTNRESIDRYINEFLNDSQLDILCIGNSCGNNIEYNDVFNRCFNTQTTSCYVLKKKFVKTLIECYFNDPTMVYTLPTDSQELANHLGIIDSSWNPLQYSHYFVIPKEKQVLQRPSYSDITNMFVDYKV
jgi:hypothetical protein